MIRSICLGVNEGEVVKFTKSESFKTFVPTVQKISKESKIDVRTVRMTLSPLSIGGDGLIKLNNFVSKMSEFTKNVGIRWFCIPINLFDKNIEELDRNIISQLLNRFDNLFINLLITKDHEIDTNASIAAAKIIRDVSRVGENGANCFRIGASSNPSPHTPFFPFSYHEGETCFSIALETNQIAIEVLEDLKLKNISNFEEEFSLRFKSALSKIDNFAISLTKETGLIFSGIDASFAPFPDDWNSVARVIETLSGSSVGGPSSVITTAYLTSLIQSLIKESGINSVGFNGVMYSVMEDNILANQSINGELNLEQLMLLSSVCGCGIDMVPISGILSPETISSYINDTASMAIRLRKSLGVRFLPIPGKLSGEITDINGDFICNARIFHAKQMPSNLLIDTSHKIHILEGFNNG